MAYQPQSMYAAANAGQNSGRQPQSLYNAGGNDAGNGRRDYAARDAQYSANRDEQQYVHDKLLPESDFNGQYVEDDEESDRYYSDEEEDVQWYARPEVRMTACASIGLAVVVTLFVRSLHGGDVGPTMTPPKYSVHQEGPTPVPDVLTHTISPDPIAPVVLMSTEAATTTRNPLLPIEDRHDSNVCTDTEEEYAGLCYKKCGLLTGGTHPLRTSSWTCCAQEPCTLGNTKGKIGTTMVCNGYDVDGEGNCPHEPGACLTNEELLLGVCYKKCSVLTQNVFPLRVGASTCCKSSDLLGCLNVMNDMTNPQFNTGGGFGDHDAATPNQAHPPLKNLTESSKSAATLSTVVPTTLPPGAGGHMATDVQCESDEELYAGLCYKKCSLLTAGGYSIRTSSWTCCQAHPCGLHNQKGSIGHTVACDGYDIGGAGAVHPTTNLACPHKPVGCATNEEMLLGMCYTKCSLLTDNQFPFRLTAATCCKEQGIRACLSINKVASSPSFNVGNIIA